MRRLAVPRQSGRLSLRTGLFLVPIPRRAATGQTVKDVTGVGPMFELVRDYESRNDMVLAGDGESDLPKGNVFRVIPRCEAADTAECHRPPQLARFVDEEWEVTILATQTAQTRRSSLCQ